MPTIQYRYVTWNSTGALGGYYNTLEGVAILSTDGQWTANFPGQHEANGIAKRSRTKHRFKKVVRTFKRLRADMTDRGLLAVSIPSFLVECLVYLVEDEYFMVETDDRYDRVRRVAMRLQKRLEAGRSGAALNEINDVKLLFGSHQGWTHANALTFIHAVVAHLGNV